MILRSKNILGVLKMSKKIVAIGGGENGRLKQDGTRIRYPYELENQEHDEPVQI